MREEENPKRKAAIKVSNAKGVTIRNNVVVGNLDVAHIENSTDVTLEDNVHLKSKQQNMTDLKSTERRGAGKSKIYLPPRKKKK